MWRKIIHLMLAAILVMVVCLPVSANDGTVPNVVDPGEDHPWGGDQYHDGGGDGIAMPPIYPSISSPYFFIRMSIDGVYGLFSTKLIKSRTDVTGKESVSVTTLSVQSQPTVPNPSRQTGN